MKEIHKGDFYLVEVGLAPGMLIDCVCVPANEVSLQPNYIPKPGQIFMVDRTSPKKWSVLVEALEPLISLPHGYSITVIDFHTGFFGRRLKADGTTSRWFGAGTAQEIESVLDKIAAA